MSRDKKNWKIRYWAGYLVELLFRRFGTRWVVGGKVNKADYTVSWQRETFEKHFKTLTDGADDYYHASILLKNLTSWDPIRMAPHVVYFLEGTNKKSAFVWRTNRSRFETLYAQLSALPIKDENERTIIDQTLASLRTMKESNRAESSHT